MPTARRVDPRTPGPQEARKIVHTSSMASGASRAGWSCRYQEVPSAGKTAPLNAGRRHTQDRRHPIEGVPMKTLIVYAHPEPKSLNGSLKDLAVSTLAAAGHEVRVSDLYAMNWKAVVDAADYGPAASSPLKVALDSGRAFDAGTLTAGCPRRAGEAAVGRRDHLPVPAVVVHDAGDPQGLGGPGVHLQLRVRRRRAQRHQVRRALRRRHPRRPEGPAVGDRRRPGGALRRSRDQRPHRRPAVPDPPRHPLLPGHRGAAAVRAVRRRPDDRRGLPGRRQGVGAAPAHPGVDRADRVPAAELR